MLKRIKHLLLRITDRRPVVKCNVYSLAPNELLKGRCALITGGTSGIGYSIAEAFLNAGASVIITGRSDERLKKACDSLSVKGQVNGYAMDNTNISSFDSILDKMLSDGGQNRYISE